MFTKISDRCRQSGLSRDASVKLRTSHNSLILIFRVYRIIHVDCYHLKCQKSFLSSLKENTNKHKDSYYLDIE